MLVVDGIRIFLNLVMKLSRTFAELIVRILLHFIFEFFEINEWCFLVNFDFEGVELVLDQLNLFQYSSSVEIGRVNSS